MVVPPEMELYPNGSYFWKVEFDPFNVYEYVASKKGFLTPKVSNGTHRLNDQFRIIEAFV